MKCFVLLSLVAYCACGPVTVNKHVLVDVHPERSEESRDPLFWQKPSYWNQEHSDYVNNWYWRYFQKYMPWTESKDVFYGDVFPWKQYGSYKSSEHVTPAQHFLNYLRYHLSDEDYLHKMLYQYTPSFFRDEKLSYEHVFPYFQHYFEQYPHKQYQDMQTPWTPAHIMLHVFQQLFEHYGQAPYTREQLMSHFMKYKVYFPYHEVSQTDLEQMVDFFYHLQFQMHSYLKHLMDSTTMEKVNQWTHFFKDLHHDTEDSEYKYGHFYKNWEQPQYKKWEESVPAEHEWSHEGVRKYGKTYQQWEQPQYKKWEETFPAEHDWSHTGVHKYGPTYQQWEQPQYKKWEETFPAEHEWSHEGVHKYGPTYQQWEQPQYKKWEETLPVEQGFRFPWTSVWNQKVRQTQYPEEVDTLYRDQPWHFQKGEPLAWWYQYKQHWTPFYEEH